MIFLTEFSSYNNKVCFAMTSYFLSTVYINSDEKLNEFVNEALNADLYTYYLFCIGS